MQFMYARIKGSKKNPGNHPVAVLAVEKHGYDAVKVSIASIHSEDRFVKVNGREIARNKLRSGICGILGVHDKVNLHEFLPKGLGKRLNSYTRHQAIFELLVKDEMEGGTWSKQNRDLVNHVDADLKHEKAEEAIRVNFPGSMYESIKNVIRAEHGCAP